MSENKSVNEGETIIAEQKLWVKETYINETNRCRIGEVDYYETAYSRTGDLFRALRKEYGKAQKMYIDCGDDRARQIGWVFTRREKYDDCDETFVRQVWVTVAASAPRFNVEYHDFRRAR